MALLDACLCYSYESGFLELNINSGRREPPIAAISHCSRQRDLVMDLISRTLGASVPQPDSNAAVGPRRPSTWASDDRLACAPGRVVRGRHSFLHPLECVEQHLEEWIVTTVPRLRAAR